MHLSARRLASSAGAEAESDEADRMTLQDALDAQGFIVVRFDGPAQIGDIITGILDPVFAVCGPLVVIGESSYAELQAQAKYLDEEYRCAPDARGKRYYRVVAE